MNRYELLTPDDLQRIGAAADEVALLELGRRVVNWDLCLINTGKKIWQ